MRNKLNLKEGEVQRILGLHKQAILKENKIILSEGHKLSLISRNGSNPFLPKTWNLKSFKITKKVGDFIKVSVVDSDKGKYDNIEINCKNKNILTIKTDGVGSDGAQNNGTTYQLGSDLIKLVTEKCSGVKKGNEEDTKTSYTTKKWNELELNTVMSGQGYRYAINKGTVFSLTKKKGIVIAKNTQIYNALSGPGMEWSKGIKTSVSFYCAQGKFYIKGEKDKNFYSSGLAKALVKSICNVDPSKVVSKDKVDGNAKNNQELETGNEKNTFLASGTSGTKYSFDFETIMKAIDDTGKCPRTGTSDQVDTSGTSGVQGTQGTSNVGDPVVIQKPTVTKDDFYQWTMD
jgi:hypothetical protein